MVHLDINFTATVWYVVVLPLTLSYRGTCFRGVDVKECSVGGRIMDSGGSGEGS